MPCITNPDKVDFTNLLEASQLNLRSFYAGCSLVEKMLS